MSHFHDDRLKPQAVFDIAPSAPEPEQTSVPASHDASKAPQEGIPAAEEAPWAAVLATVEASSRTAPGIPDAAAGRGAHEVGTVRALALAEPAALPVLSAPGDTSVVLPAREGWQGWLNRLGLRLQPGTQEATERLNVATTCSNLSQARTIVVANLKGSAGRTTLATTLAGAIGTARGGGVVVFDAAPSGGNLGDRTISGGSTFCVRDLLDDARADGSRKEDLDRYLRHQASGQFKVLTSAPKGAQPLSAAEFQQVHHLLTTFYDVVIVDTGSEDNATWRAAMEAANQLIVPVKWRADSCLAADQMLNVLLDNGGRDLIAHAIVVGTNGPSDATKDKERLRAHFEAKAAHALGLPIDAHLHAGAAIQHLALRSETRRAALNIAAHVFQHLREIPPQRTETAQHQLGTQTEPIVERN